MHIDAHQHFWIYDPREDGWIDDSMAALRRDFLPADLNPELERGGFQGCVAVQARQTLEETRWLLELAEQDERFLVQPDFLRGIAMLEEFDLAYDILIYTRHLPVATEFVARFPRQRFVLDHMAKPPIKSGALDVWARGMREIAAFPNVSCKVSGLVTEADWQAWKPADLRPYLDVAFECFGASRLMIGSDWPVCAVAAPYARVMNVVKDYLGKYTASERDAVLGGNAAAFWRLKRTEKQVRD